MTILYFQKKNCCVIILLIDYVVKFFLSNKLLNAKVDLTLECIIGYKKYILFDNNHCLRYIWYGSQIMECFVWTY
jgi:hypothetical protein